MKARNHATARGDIQFGKFVRGYAHLGESAFSRHSNLKTSGNQLCWKDQDNLSFIHILLFFGYKQSFLKVLSIFKKIYILCMYQM